MSKRIEVLLEQIRTVVVIIYLLLVVLCTLTVLFACSGESPYKKAERCRQEMVEAHANCEALDTQCFADVSEDYQECLADGGALYQ
jgi:hypothetical protein